MKEIVQDLKIISIKDRKELEEFFLSLGIK